MEKEQDKEMVASSAIFNRNYFTKWIKNYQKKYDENKGIFGGIKKSFGLHKLPKEDQDFLNSAVRVNEWIETGNGNILQDLQGIYPYLPKETVDDSLFLKKLGLEDILKQRIKQIGKTSNEIYINGNPSRLEYLNQLSMARMFPNMNPENLQKLKGEFEVNTKYNYYDFLSAQSRAESIFDAHIDLGLEIPETDAKKEFSSFFGVYIGTRGNKEIDPDLQKEMDKSFLSFNNKVQKYLQGILVSK
jgi:hypothetical protein